MAAVARREFAASLAPIGCEVATIWRRSCRSGPGSPGCLLVFRRRLAGRPGPASSRPAPAPASPARHPRASTASRMRSASAAVNSPKWVVTIAALPVAEHREREADGLHAEGGGRIERLLLADQQRVVDLHLVRVGEHLVAEVDRDADDLEALARRVALQLLQQRDLPPAGCAPGRPEVDDQRLARPVRQRARLAVPVRQRELRQRWRPACCGLGCRVRRGRRGRRGAGRWSL